VNIDDACKLSVEHIAAHGCSDITHEQLERALLLKYKDLLIAEVKTKIRGGNINEMEFKPIQYILTPKNRYVFDYRKAAIIDPVCLAKYTAIVLMAAEDIEKARIPITEKIVFSYRFSPSGTELFSKDTNYNSWRERVRELADSDSCKYIVQCDIASFYDRANIHRLESTLLSIGVDQGLVRQINGLLLLWSKKDSYGIPVGNSASRILAEAALIEIDKFLLAQKVIFSRYVDDYRFFAPDITTAQRWMNLLTTRLFRDGLMLNTGKTKLYLAKKNDEPEQIQPEETPEAIVTKVTKLTGGYNRIVRTFFMPSSEKYAPFLKIDLIKEIANLTSQGIPEFEGIQKIIIACLVQQKFSELEKVAIICGEYLYSLDYFVDMLKKNVDVIPSENQKKISEYYASMVTSAEFGALEWHQASIASLLSHKAYFNKSALMHIIRTSNKESGTYPSMIALEGLKGNLTRGEFLDLREWFDRCDDWEKRRILSASSALPTEERKAWGRATKPMLHSDFLGRHLASDISGGIEP
jgi:hypothetical protein